MTWRLLPGFIAFVIREARKRFGWYLLYWRVQWLAQRTGEDPHTLWRRAKGLVREYARCPPSELRKS